MQRFYVLEVGFAILFYAAHCARPLMAKAQRANRQDEPINRTELVRKPEEVLVFYQGKDGTPGVDFPIYSHIPRTSFSCKGIESGYYADLDTDCQVFHICEEERKISFLCPNGTIFQQADLICEWWFKVNCTDAPNLYAESAEHLRQDMAKRKSFRKHNLDGHEINHGAIMRTEEGLQVTVSRHERRKSVSTNQQLTAITTTTQKPLSNQSSRKRNRAENNDIETQTSTQTGINQIVGESKGSTRPQQVSHTKTRRYNDAQTGNYINGNQESGNQNANRKIDTSEKTSEVDQKKSQTLKPYHIQFSVTSSASDESQNRNYRGKIKHTTPIPSTNQDNSNDYDQQFPTHKYENSVKSTSTEKTAFSSSYVDVSVQPESEVDEFQTQESASFVKNSFNSLKNSDKYSTSNPYPNHRTTYSDIKQSNYSPSKLTNSISSVTPQYITTQPINNGKPFLGSRVGVTIQTSIGSLLSEYNSTYENGTPDNSVDNTIPTTTPQDSDLNENRSTSPYESNTYPSYDEDSKKTAKFLLSKTKVTNQNTPIEVTANPLSVTPNYESPNQVSNIEINDEKEYYSSGRTGKTLSPSASTAHWYVSSTSPTPTYLPSPRSTFSPNEHTTRNIDHGTDDHVIPVSINNHVEKITIHLSKSHGDTSPQSSFNQAKFTTKNIPIEYETKPGKTRIEIVNSDGENQESANERGQISFTSPKPESTTFESTLPTLTDSEQLLTSSTTNGGHRDEIRLLHTSSPQYEASSYDSSTASSVRFGKTSFSTTEQPKIKSKTTGSVYLPLTLSEDGKKFSSSVQPPLGTYIKEGDIQRTKTNTPGTGFFVTKISGLESTTNKYAIKAPGISSTPQSVPVSYNRPERTTLRPRPFQKFSYSSSSDIDENTVTPTFSYRISSARPFKLPERETEAKFTPDPTVPTVFTTPIPFKQNVDDMMKVLMKIVKQNGKDYSSETPRPGLVIPPSVGPQTLHTLAAYFANALDGVVADKAKQSEGDPDLDTEDRLNSLLTQMTVHGYSLLFKENDQEGTEQTTTDQNKINDNGLETDSSKTFVDTPQIRELAKNFSVALSSYLQNPEMFRKDLEEFRPTEPTATEEREEERTTAGDEELLNFSDADSKSSYSPIFPSSTPSSTYAPPPSPTWGYILAKPENSLDIKNSLNPDLNTADSQSFFSGYNNLNVKDKSRKVSDSSSTSAKLWKNHLSVNPAALNDQFGATPSITLDDSESKESIESSSIENIAPVEGPNDDIHYEIQTLPKVTLNSTRIHGILIDLMNSTTPDSDRLHRILQKLNTTESEFLEKMREIESNPLTRRLILLLISECGMNVAKEMSASSSDESIEVTASPGLTREGILEPTGKSGSNSYIPKLVNPTLNEDDQDVRALQLLNSLYSIASKFGK